MRRTTLFKYFSTSLSSQHQQLTWSHKLQFNDPLNKPAAPVFRLLGLEGQLLNKERESRLSDDHAVKLYEKMIKLNTLDQILYMSQRQGRISFYMTSFGEEASVIGSAAALDSEDCVYSQYRETGVLIEREASLELLLAQCFGNQQDIGKGRQMPIHYGSRKLNFITVSSPLATQMPQAAGHAYALKLRQKEPKKTLVACYFGEGAASEGDAHAAMNFAATLRCPVLFFCRNNQWAISTPASEQYAGEGVAARASGYGITSIRVDGNDLFAIYEATQAARELALQESRPVLIEALTYRLGHHSTSDDASAYQDPKELKERETADDHPLKRIDRYLKAQNLWCGNKEEETRKEFSEEIKIALTKAEQVKRAPVSSMFEDVYSELPANLIRQRAELNEHLNRFAGHYPTNKYAGI